MAEMKKFNELKHDVIRHGGFFTNFYFDLHSSNPHTLQDIMVGFASKITNEKGVKMGVAEIDEPIEREGIFSSTAKVSMLIENFETLVRLTMVYTPIAIDIEEPLDAKIDAGEIQLALIAISANAQEMSKHILTKTMTPEQKQKFNAHMANKALLGRRLRGEALDEQKKENEGK